MRHLSGGRAAFATLVLAVLASLAQGEPSHSPSNPATGFVPNAHVAKSAYVDLSSVVALRQHGNGNGGTDYGYHNVGVIFGAKVYSGTYAVAIELYFYIPSQPDYLYRDGDFRGSTGRIGNATGADGGEYYCPEGYAAVGMQGSSGLAIDRVGLLCGKIGDFSKLVSMPLFGGNGGGPFSDNCASVQSSGLMTGVRVRSSSWMDSIQALCQAGGPISVAAPENAPPLPAPPVPKSASKLADERASAIAVGTSRSEVLEKLGEPFSKISGDSERFTYQLESGATLRLVIEDGRVTQIQNGHH
jgi:hypothetical protein